MAYDQARHNVVLFGGLAGQSPLDDTWTWNGSAWTERQGLTVMPPGRQGAAMAYDEVDQKVILFGGLGSNGVLGDTWAWDGTAWQELHPAHSPSKRQDATATYDLALREVLLYGGVDQAGAQATTINETWAWSNGDWSQLSVAGPAGGLRPRTAYLIGANLVDRFGDCSTRHDAGVYAFDGNTWGPRTTSGTPPPALCLPSLAGNTVQRGVLLFGGNPGTGVSPVPADTYVYDGDVWHKPSPAQSPPARDDAAMVFDSDHQVMVLFGGLGLNQGQTGPLNDTWTWDGTNWTSH
jgi:galactose oxidase-like protein